MMDAEVIPISHIADHKGGEPMRRVKESRSIYRQFLLLAILTVLALWLVLGISVYWTRLTLQRQSEIYLKNSSSQLETVVHQNYITYIKTMQLVSYNADIQNFLLARQGPTRVKLYSTLKQTLASFSALNDQILDIVILDSDEHPYNLGDTLSYPLPVMSGLADGPVVSTRQETFRGDIPLYYLVMAQDIYSTSNYLQTSEKIGSLYFILSPSAFVGGEQFGEFEDGNQLFLTDSSGHVLWGNSTRATQDNFDMIRNSQNQSNDYLLQVNLDTPSFQITAYRADLPLLGAGRWETALLICALLIVVALCIFWIMWGRRLVTPLVQLTAFTEEICSSDLSTLSKHVSLSGYQEAEVLSAGINHMLERIAALTDSVIEKNAALYKSELLVKQSELMHLRSQINPHFLYNTLETMVGIAYTEGLPQIAEIARALSLIFKYIVKGTDMVPLQNELKIAKNYLLIQGIRFEGRFTTIYQLNADCMQIAVPKMILQPLIENAIVHGIEGQRKLCELILAAQREEDTLVLTVADNGSGIAPEELEQIHNRLQREHSLGEPANHIGMQNVHERIRLIYGKKYGLSIDSVLGQGTTVRLTIPITTSGEGS